MKKDNFLALSIFVLLWIISLLILWILPIQSSFDNTEESILLIILFIISISATAIIWYEFTKNIRFGIRRTTPISLEKISFIIRWSALSTMLGNLFVYFDRTVIRGIDYSRGFRDARYQWETSTVSGSMISIAGNLMIPFSYCALFMGLFHWELISKKQKIISLIAGFGGQLGIAMLNGGRSNIFLAIVFAFVVCVLRKYNGKSFFPKFKGRAVLVLSAAVGLLSYVQSILYWIADNDDTYLRLVADMLGAKVSSGYISNPLINMMTEVFLYILHGIYYISAVISSTPVLSDINHNMSFRWIFAMLARTPILKGYSMELPNFDGGGGNFVALPGILLYDYGYIGFFISCIILGILLGAVLRILNSGRNDFGMFELMAVLFVLIHLYMSMMTMALSFGYFMFMMFAMLCMELISRIKYGDSGWMNV